MKKRKNFWAAIIVSATLVLGLSVCEVRASPPPPPGNHGQNGNQGGGFAPIGEGLVLLLSMGLAYGGKKTYKMYQATKNNHGDDSPNSDG